MCYNINVTYLNIKNNKIKRFGEIESKTEKVKIFNTLRGNLCLKFKYVLISGNSSCNVCHNHFHYLSRISLEIIFCVKRLSEVLVSSALFHNAFITINLTKSSSGFMN